MYKLIARISWFLMGYGLIYPLAHRLYQWSVARV